MNCMLSRWLTCCLCLLLTGYAGMLPAQSYAQDGLTMHRSLLPVPDAPGVQHELVVVDVVDAQGLPNTLWLLRKNKTTTVLGQSSYTHDSLRLPRICEALSASADGHFLAIQTRGESQVWIEVIDLPFLLRTGKCAVLMEINPAPGSIGLVGWKGNSLWLRSDIDLTFKNLGGELREGARLPNDQLFKFDPYTRQYSRVR